MSYTAAATRRGFTLIEILTVVAIIAVLMGITVYAVIGARRTMKINAARADLAVFRSAIERYRETYGQWPARTLPDAGGALKNFEIVRLLRNWKIGVPLGDASGRDGHFSRDPMLEKLDPAQLDGNGNWRDPWSSAYAVGIIPDDAWKVYQKFAANQNLPLTPDEAAAIEPYGSSPDHALYWVKCVRGQVDVYSFGPDHQCDYGYGFGDGSGYRKGAWGYYNSGDDDATPVAKRGDDIRR